MTMFWISTQLYPLMIIAKLKLYQSLTRPEWKVKILNQTIRYVDNPYNYELCMFHRIRYYWSSIKNRPIVNSSCLSNNEIETNQFFHYSILVIRPYFIRPSLDPPNFQGLKQGLNSFRLSKSWILMDYYLLPCRHLLSQE